jgi:hypothetical protein
MAFAVGGDQYLLSDDTDTTVTPGNAAGGYHEAAAWSTYTSPNSYVWGQQGSLVIHPTDFRVVW